MNYAIIDTGDHKGKSKRYIDTFLRLIGLLTILGFIVVVSGEIEIIYGKETHRLSAGDSIYYNSVVPHHVGSIGDAAASIYAVLYFPE